MTVTCREQSQAHRIDMVCSFFDRLKEAREEKKKRNMKFKIYKKPKINIITVTRSIFTDNSTVGELFMPGSSNRYCYTLEDTVRKSKIPGRTAIPSGRYEIKILESTRYKRMMPYLMDVKYFSAIMIHPGNTEHDTKGCILVGKNQMSDFVSHSQETFDALYEDILGLLTVDKLWIDVIGGYTEDQWAEAHHG